jgi:hypothetical protein
MVETRPWRLLMYTAVVVSGVGLGLVWWAVNRIKNGVLNLLARLTADNTESDEPLLAGDPTSEQLDEMQRQV